METTMSTTMDRLLKIVSRYINTDNIDTTANLHLPPFGLSGNDMAYIFIDIEKEFSIDLDKLFDHVTFHSIDAIADGITCLVCEKSDY